MLYNWAKNKQDEKRIKEWWNSFLFKNGHKEVNINNFIKLNYTFISYKVDKRYYSGYFTKKEEDKIFEVLDYHEGKIRSIAG